MEEENKLDELKKKFMNDEISPEEYRGEKEKIEKEIEAEEKLKLGRSIGIKEEAKEENMKEPEHQETEKVLGESLKEPEEKVGEEIEIKEPEHQETEKVLGDSLKEPEEKVGEEIEIIKKTRAKRGKKKNYVYECEGCGRIYPSYKEAEECEKTHDCCAHVKDRKKGFINGIIYGLVPHTFCILFIIGSILGVTLFTSFFKPFLANKNFFYILMGLSFGFATLSALFYLKRNNCLCFSGARKRWKFLSILYTITIAINLLFFFVIFPAVANLSLGSVTGGVISSGSGNSNTNSNYPSLTLKVNIPCSGHAPLIISELKKVQGVVDVKYRSGKFNVYYDSSQTSKEKILGIDIFKEYPAKVVSESSASAISAVLAEPSSGSAPSASTGSSGGSCCGGTGGCGGGCGGSGGGCGR